eukprot:SAG22_NODE_9780_length_569_cov_11.151064_1_plen_49_part_10
MIGRRFSRAGRGGESQRSLDSIRISLVIAVICICLYISANDLLRLHGPG